jgi:hypothetical protein
VKMAYSLVTGEGKEEEPWVVVAKAVEVEGGTPQTASQHGPATFCLSTRQKVAQPPWPLPSEHCSYLGPRLFVIRHTQQLCVHETQFRSDSCNTHWLHHSPSPFSIS